MRYKLSLLFPCRTANNSTENPLKTSTWLIAFLVLGFLCLGSHDLAAASRSTLIPYDSIYWLPPDSKIIALDTPRKQIFTAILNLDRVDVLSTVDYHLIHSITVPSPSTLDISPDGSTLAVGTSASHVSFFSTTTFAKTNDIVFPGAALGITAFLYTANGNAIIRAAEGLATGGGVTTYWDHFTNSFINTSAAGQTASTAYSATGPLARSGDYSRVILGDAGSGGEVQVIDGNNGQILFSTGFVGFGGYILSVGANKDASRYALCVDDTWTVSLLILDSAFGEIYEDPHGCVGLTFSADGNTLYRDVNVDTVGYTQALDMTSFTARNVPNYFSTVVAGFGNGNTYWEASDATGMIYGINTNFPKEMLWIAQDTTVSTAPKLPDLTYPLQIVKVIDNIGSPQGGDTIRLLCLGLGSGTTSVTIGDAAATNVAVAAQTWPTLPGQSIVTVKTPPGTAGLADVVLTSNGKSYTVSKGFRYATSRTIFPFATSPSFLVYDNLRNRLYAAHKDQIEVIDAAGKTALTPLVPASGKPANSSFAGISLSPDGNRLYVADAGANMIHMLDLANPGKGYSVAVPTATGLIPSNSPARVFELSNGKLLGSIGGASGSGQGGLFLVAPGTLKADWARSSDGNPIEAYVWNSTNGGENILLSAGLGGMDSDSIGLWNTGSAFNVNPSNVTMSYPDHAANEDGTIVALGNGDTDFYPYIVDFNLYPVGLVNRNFNVQMPDLTPGLVLHPSGALLYQAGRSKVAGIPLPGGTMQIDDLHQWQLTASVAFPEPIAQAVPGCIGALTCQMIATDSTGRNLFAVTQSGISMLVLDTIPLSIGNIKPEFVQPQGGQHITIRGSGFQTGAAVSIGGKQAATTYVDENTLTVDTPALTSGWMDVTVSLPSGSTYTAPGILQVVGAEPAPVITGFSPASIIVQANFPGFNTTTPVTILGSGFAVEDTVEINGQPVSSVFIDARHMQATIPATLTGITGSIHIDVVSPHTGTSNVMALPMINPVPALIDNQPFTVVPGNQLGLVLTGTGFVAASTIQWNGQNLATALNGGGSSLGLESVYASVPGSLTQKAGTATVTVFNPAPGGGVSNAISVDISPAHPVLELAVSKSANDIQGYYSFPASIDFGSEIVTVPITYNLYIRNIGTGNYTISSSTVTPGPFSTQNIPCVDISPQSTTSCSVPLIFTPTAAGAATATLTITDNTHDSPHTVTLTGNGVTTFVPSVTLNRINSDSQTVTVSFTGSTVVGGPTIPGTAWVEYGTDPALNTFIKSTPLTFTGDGALGGNLTGLTPATAYAARLVVQTAWGTGKSTIQKFAMEPASPSIRLDPASGTTGTVTVTAGQTATYSLLAWDGGNGYTGSVSLTCSGDVTAGTCTVSPSQFTVGLTPTPITVTVTTTARTTAQYKRAYDGMTLAFGMLFGTGVLAFRRKLRYLGLLLCLAAAPLAFTSCGGGGSAGTPAPPPTPTGTPAGTYTLTITATTGGFQTPTNLLTLIVK